MRFANKEGRFPKTVRKVASVLRLLGLPYLWLCKLYATYIGGVYQLYSVQQSVKYSIPTYHWKYHLRFLEGADWKRYGTSNLYPAIYAEKKRIGKANINIIEVGSSWGEEVAYLSELASQGRVYCFEPHPDSFACLTQNIVDTRLTNVIARHAAVGRQDGWMTIRKERIWARNHVDAADGEGVQVLSLDGLFKDEVIDLIKIDTDGYEIEVIEGALNLIKRSNAVVFAEFLPNMDYRGRSGVEVLKHYSRMGFTIRHPQFGNLIIKEEEFEEFLALLSSRHASISHDIILRLD